MGSNPTLSASLVIRGATSGVALPLSTSHAVWLVFIARVQRNVSSVARFALHGHFSWRSFTPPRAPRPAPNPFTSR